MAYEKLSVVYEYRDDTDDEGSGQEEKCLNSKRNTNNDTDWWKDEAETQNDNGKLSGMTLMSSEPTHNYDKLTTEPPGKTDRTTQGNTDGGQKTRNGLASNESPEQNRKSMSERFKGVLSSATEGLSNWVLMSTSNSVPVDPFICGAIGNINQEVHNTRMMEPRRY